MHVLCPLSSLLRDARAHSRPSAPGAVYVQKSIKTLPKWLSRLHSLSALAVPGSVSELAWSALNFHINCTDFGTIWSSEAINAELIRTVLEH